MAWGLRASTGTPIAYTFGTREHKYLDELLTLLKPFNIKKVYANHNYAYQDKIPSDILVCRKKNTQKIERNHLTLRIRIKRLAKNDLLF